ncbi:MAG: hypothetical protein EP329_24050 [Deltaproteobacteria bacterium]|nr:MAG: hypothetical protein EP329_24050 [Deltaproteobacteria bacterium]
MRALPVAFAALASLAALASRAEAAPCCMSATAFGTGRLLIWEDAAVGLRTSLARGLGQWDGDGQWRPYDGYDELEWRSELWGMAALSRRASLFARAPFVATRRHAGALDGFDGGLADVSAGLRYEILSIGEVLELPAIAVTVSVTAPTGRPTWDAATPLGVDVTGRGAWALGAGLSLEHTAMPWFVRVDVGATVPLPAERPDLGVDQRFGPELVTDVAGGVELTEGLVTSLVARLTWASEIVLDGASVDGSGRLDVGLGAALSWRFAYHWTLQLAVDTGLFVDGLGDNQPGRLTGTLGLRYGVF